MPQQQTTRWKHTLLATGVLFLLSISLYAQHWAALDGDKLLAMQIAHLWVSGKRLYVDLLQLNPPTIYVMYGLIIRSAAMLGITDASMLFIAVTSLCVASAYLIHRLLTYHPHYVGGLHKAHVFYLLLAFIVLPNPAHYGDREHLFFVLTLPFLLKCCPSLRHIPISSGLNLAIILMASVGFVIKPYCLVVYGVALLAVMAQERSLRSLLSPAIIGTGIAILLLIGVMAVYTPEYFTVLIPLAFLTYKKVALGVGVIVFVTQALLYLMIPLADFRFRVTSPYRRDILYLFMLLLGYAAYIACNNGWEYTFYPFNAMVLYLTGWLWLEYRTLYQQNCATDTAIAKRGLFGARACIFAITLHGMLVLVIYAAAWDEVASATTAGKKGHAFGDELVEVMESQQSKTFGVLAGTFSPWPYISHVTGATQETRFSELWMLPKFITGDDAFRQNHSDILQYVSTALADDLTRNKPGIMFVDASPEFYETERKVDLIALLSQNPAFSEAWKYYRFLRAVDYCHADAIRKGRYQNNCRYDVYIRSTSE